MERDGLIDHVVGHYKANAWVDCNMVFADYYFAETVAEMLGVEPLV